MKEFDKSISKSSTKVFDCPTFAHDREGRLTNFSRRITNEVDVGVDDPPTPSLVVRLFRDGDGDVGADHLPTPPFILIVT